MRKYVIIISTVSFIALVLFIGIVSQNNSNMQKNDWFIQNGIYYNAINSKPYNGFITQKALNKTVVTEINNGEKIGWFKVFNDNNSLEMKGKLVKNMNQGKWTYYHSNGNIQSVGYFDNDVPVGKWIWYYDNAKIKEICTFYNGVRNGECLRFNKDGKIVDKRFYSNGIEKQSIGI